MPRHFLCLLLLAGSTAFAATPRVLPSIEFNASMDKKNVQVQFEEGAVGGVVNDEELSGIYGNVSGFTAKPAPATILLDDSVTEQRLMELVNFQGRLKGVLQCKRVRVGTSPINPQAGVQVVAEGCIIKSINH